MQNPEPGIYPGIPPHVYHSWPYASNSRLSTMATRSPAHMRAEMDDPRPSTDAQALGDVIHTAILEPDVFADRYAVAPKVDRRTKEGKAVYAEFVEASGGKTVITASDDITALRIAESVTRHPRLSKLLSAPGQAELSIVWDDEASGVRCKARIDRFCEFASGNVVLDVKSTRNASPREFGRAIANYGYYRQLAMYRAGLEAHGMQMDHLVFLAVEKEAPYAVAGYRLDNAAAEQGAMEVRELLLQYAECERTGIWPSYPEDIIELTLPSWKWREVEQDLNEL